MSAVNYTRGVISRGHEVEEEEERRRITTRVFSYRFHKEIF